MEMSRMKFGLTIALIILLTATSTYAITSLYSSYSASQHQTPSPKANVFIFIETTKGSWQLGSGNVITNIGEQETRDRHSQNDTYVAVNWISIGNVTAGATKTQLDSEYQRKLGSVTEWTNSGDYAFNLTMTHMFTETQRIDGTGAHWASSGDNNMYACANFDATTFNSNDNVTIVWAFTYDAN